MQQFKRFYWVTVHTWKSANWNTFIRPWSMDFTLLGRGAAMRPLHLGARPSPIRIYFPPQNGLYYRQKYFSVSSAVRVAGHRRSRRWRKWMSRSWAGVVTLGLQLCGRLDILPNSLKLIWRRLMVEKLTLNYLETALVDIPAVSMPIARSLKSWDICGHVMCDKTAHFRVAFYCPQHKVHLCNEHAV